MKKGGKKRALIVEGGKEGVREREGGQEGGRVGGNEGCPTLVVSGSFMSVIIGCGA